MVTNNFKQPSAIRIGTTVLAYDPTHLSVYTKYYQREIVGLRGTNNNLPTGRYMTHIDIRFIITGEEYSVYRPAQNTTGDNTDVSDNYVNTTDFSEVTRLVAQFRAAHFLPLKTAGDKKTDILELLIDPVKTNIKTSISSKVKFLDKASSAVQDTKSSIPLLLRELETLRSKIDKDIQKSMETNVKAYTLKIGVRSLKYIKSNLYLRYLKDFEKNNTKADLEDIGTLIKLVKGGINYKHIYNQLNTATILNSTDRPKSFESKINLSFKQASKEIATAIKSSDNSFNPDIFQKYVFIYIKLNKAQEKLRLLESSVVSVTGVKEEEFNKNFVDASSTIQVSLENIELTSHQDIKPGAIVKLSMIYFNTDPYISSIRYYKPIKATQTNNNTSSMDYTTKLEESELFDKFYNTKFISNSKLIVDTVSKPLEKQREKNVCFIPDLSVTQSNTNTTSLLYDIYEYTVQPINPSNGEAHVERDIKELTAQGGEFAKRLIRKYSKEPKRINLLTDDKIISIQTRLVHEAAILPIQGAKHPTMQFYTKPRGSVAINLLLDTNIESDVTLLEQLKSSMEEINAKFNRNSLDRFIRLNPIIVANPLVNMLGMHYFNFEDISIQSVEARPGLLNITITFNEQIVPPVADDGEVSKGIKRLVKNESISSTPLSSVLRFIADKKISEDKGSSFLSNLQSEFFLKLTSNILTEEVWYKFMLDHMMPEVSTVVDTSNVNWGSDANNPLAAAAEIAAKGALNTATYLFRNTDAIYQAVYDPNDTSDLQKFYNNLLTLTSNNSKLANPFIAMENTVDPKNPVDFTDIKGIPKSITSFNKYEANAMLRSLLSIDIIGYYKYGVSSDSSFATYINTLSDRTTGSPPSFSSVMSKFIRGSTTAKEAELIKDIVRDNDVFTLFQNLGVIGNSLDISKRIADDITFNILNRDYVLISKNKTELYTSNLFGNEWYTADFLDDTLPFPTDFIASSFELDNNAYTNSIDRNYTLLYHNLYVDQLIAALNKDFNLGITKEQLEQLKKQMSADGIDQAVALIGNNIGATAVESANSVGHFSISIAVSMYLLQKGFSDAPIKDVTSANQKIKLLNFLLGNSDNLKRAIDNWSRLYKSNKLIIEAGNVANIVDLKNITLFKKSLVISKELYSTSTAVLVSILKIPLRLGKSSLFNLIKTSKYIVFPTYTTGYFLKSAKFIIGEEKIVELLKKSVGFSKIVSRIASTGNKVYKSAKSVYTKVVGGLNSVTSGLATPIAAALLLGPAWLDNVLADNIIRDIRDAVKKTVDNFYSVKVMSALKQGYIPNSNTIDALSSTIASFKETNNELNSMYTRLLEIGYEVPVLKNNSEKFSAYPDLNLPMYNELFSFTSEDLSILGSSIIKIKKELINIPIVNSKVDKIKNSYLKVIENVSIKLSDLINSDISKEVINKETSLLSSSLVAGLTRFNSNLLAVSTDFTERVTLFSSSKKFTTLILVLISKLKKLSPELLDTLLPTYYELGLEPPYIPSVKDPTSIKSRGLDDFVDPTFYIVRETAKVSSKASESVAAAVSTIKMYTSKDSDTTSISVNQDNIPRTSDSLIASASMTKNVENLVPKGEHKIKTATNLLERISSPSAQISGAVKKGKKSTFTVKQADNYAKRKMSETPSDVAMELQSHDRFTPVERNTLQKAFPTFAVYFIREFDNKFTENHLMADTYYYQNVIDFSISKDKFRGSVATLTLLNLYGIFDNDAFGKPRKPKEGEDIKTYDVASKFHLSDIKLAQGTIVQVRQGYSSNPDELEIVFSGKISEITPGEQTLAIIMQGHEHELMNHHRLELDVGFYTGKNFFDYAAQLLSYTESFGNKFSSRDLQNIREQKKAHKKEFAAPTSSARFISSFLTSHLHASRTTENIWTGGVDSGFLDWLLNDDFKIYDTTLLEGLYEISRYLPDFVALPLPYDTRSTFFLGPPNHFYKYTSEHNDSLKKFIGDKTKISLALRNVSDVANKLGTTKIGTNFLTLILKTGESVQRAITDNLSRNSYSSTTIIKSYLIGAFNEANILLVSNSKNISASDRFKKSPAQLSELDQLVPEIKYLLHYTLRDKFADVINRVNSRIDTSNILTQELSARDKDIFNFSELFFIQGFVAPGLVYNKKTVAYMHKAIKQDNSKTDGQQKITNPINSILQRDFKKITSKIPLQYKLIIVKSFIQNYILTLSNRANTINTTILQLSSDSSISNSILDSIKNIVRDTHDLASTSKVRIRVVDIDGTIARFLQALEDSNSYFVVSGILEEIIDTSKYDAVFWMASFKAYFLTMCYLTSKLLKKEISSDDLKSLAKQEDAIVQHNAKLSIFPGHKSFRSYHRVTSNDIIRNEIECTVAEMANEIHVMTPTSLTDGSRDVSSVVTDLLFGDPTNSDSYWSNNVVSFDPFQPAGQRLVRIVKEINAVNRFDKLNIAYRDLAEAMKPMYRGQIVLVGRRNIKPYDMVTISDDYNKIYGSFEVACVVHNHTMHSGWTTTIKPHLITHSIQAQRHYGLLLVDMVLGTANAALDLYMLATGAKAIFSGSKLLLNTAKSTLGKGTLLSIGDKTALSATTWRFTKQWLGLQAVSGFIAPLIGNIINSDVVNNSLIQPSFVIHPKGILSDSDYFKIGMAKTLEQLEVLQSSQTFKSHLHPVFCQPLTKNGHPWTAGLKGTSLSNVKGMFPLAKAFTLDYLDMLSRGVTVFDENLGFASEDMLEGLQRYYQNFTNL